MELFSTDELLQFNEQLLGRGAPTQDDGIGYNKADYGQCSSYLDTLTIYQLADLSGRLVKYCNTQLKVDRKKMVNTHSDLLNKCGAVDVRANAKKSISISLIDNKVAVSFKYNDVAVGIMRKYRARWSPENRYWIFFSIESTISALTTLGDYRFNVSESLERLYEYEASLK